VPALAPDTVVAILSSARGPAPDPRLSQVLSDIRREWEALGRRRYSGLGDAIEDALQTGLLKLIDPVRLATLKDPTRLGAWGRSIFIHAVMDVARDARRHRGSMPLGLPGDNPDDVLRDRLPALEPTPEEIAAGRERLAIVARQIERFEVAKLRFLEDLPEKDIAEQRGLSRDGVAGQLKRIRKAIRKALEDPE